MAISRLLCTSIVMVLVSGMFVSPVNAKIKKLGQSGFKFLSQPVGARGAAMGSAYMSVAQDASAVFWNPAGMARLEKRSFFFDATKGIADINYYAAAFAFSMEDYGVLGINAVVMDYGDLVGTQFNGLTGDYSFTGNYSPTAFAIGLSYARTMTDRFGFGVTLKLARQDLGSFQTLSAGADGTSVTTEDVSHSLNVAVFDIGVMYYTHIRGIAFGAAFRNFSRERKFIADEFAMPLELKFGGVVDVVDLFSLHGLGSNHTATFTSDFQHSRDFSSRVHYGGEYWYRGALALRGGYKANYDEEAATFGAGIRATVENTAVQFDYAFNDFGGFGSVHKFSIGLEF